MLGFFSAIFCQKNKNSVTNKFTIFVLQTLQHNQKNEKINYNNGFGTTNYTNESK